MTGALSCRAISRVFRSPGVPTVTAVDHVDLDVAAGSFVAVEGPSGSGKTTLLGLLAGIEPPDSGTITLLGHDLNRLGPTERARLRRLRLGLVFQSFGLVPSLNVLDNVALPLTLESVTRAERTERAQAALESVGLGDVVNKRIDELSGGQRQRVGVARAVVSEPAIILADEPTGSLDDETAASIIALLRERARAVEATLILVTHDPASAALADVRYRMHDGRLTSSGRPEVAP
jgi:putative ABC transport system ATP-binding protein